MLEATTPSEGLVACPDPGSPQWLTIEAAAARYDAAILAAGVPVHRFPAMSTAEIFAREVAVQCPSKPVQDRRMSMYVVDLLAERAIHNAPKPAPIIPTGFRRVGRKFGDVQDACGAQTFGTWTARDGRRSTEKRLPDAEGPLGGWAALGFADWVGGFVVLMALHEGTTAEDEFQAELLWSRARRRVDERCERDDAYLMAVHGNDLETYLAAVAAEHDLVLAEEAQHALAATTASR